MILITVQSSYCNEPLITPDNDDDIFPRTAIFGEAGGNGVFLSLNYEHFVSKDFGLRAGVGSTFVYGMTYPVMMNYYFGGKNKLEIGAGVTVIPGHVVEIFGENKGVILNSTIGLRHQKDEGGLIIRLAFTPFYNPQLNRVKIFGGISIGKSF